MPAELREYRLRIRNQDDDANLLILSSRAGDANCLLTEEPNSDGQRVDVFLGTQEIGVVVWRAIDRDDGSASRTITAQLADENARNQMLSNVCVGEYAIDGGAWVAFHTGYLNDISLPDSLVYEFTVGDTDRREQDAELFKALTPTFNRGSYIIGGPIPARTPTEHGDPPQVSFAGVRDFGPVRMEKVATTAGGTNVVAFEIVSGYVRPYYRQSLTAIGADEVETINRFARQWAVPVGNKFGSSGRHSRAMFPGLIARFTPVAGGAAFDRVPVGVPVTSPFASIDRLVIGSGMGMYIHWPAPFIVPDNGTQYDVIVFPNEVSENAPLHWAGNPVDLVTLAWDQEGIPYNAAAAAAVRAVLEAFWVEYRFTGVVPLSELVSDYVFGPYGIAARSGANGEKVLKLVRDVIPASVATVGVNDVPTDE